MAREAPFWDRQLVLVTGKGGVGKTTLTAAIARIAHSTGKRVLVAEVTHDPETPSLLLTHFGHPMLKGDEPVLIEPRLHGVRLAPQIGHKLFLRAALKVGLLVDAAMRSAALNRFLMAAPTFPEIGVLFQIVTMVRSGRFDHIVIDLPATGHAVALASLPRTVNRIVPTGLIGDAVKEGLDVMTDPARTSAVVVSLPESMPVTEGVELIDALHRLQIRVPVSILNRVPSDPFTQDQRAALIDMLKDRAPDDPVLGVRELRRLDRARRARTEFYETTPPGVRTLEIPLFESADEVAVIALVTKALEAEPTPAKEHATT